MNDQTKKATVPNGPEDAPSGRKVKRTFVSLVALIIAMVIIHFWILNHFESFPIFKYTVMFLTAATALFGLLAQYFSDDEKNAVKKGMRNLLEFSLRPKFLISLYGITLLAVLFISSVTFSTARLQQDLSVRIAPHEPGLEKAAYRLIQTDESATFPQFILPWGRPCFFDGKGIQTGSVMLYPWLSASPEIRPEPSLLLRFLAEPPVFRDGWIIVFHDGDSIYRIDNDGFNAIRIGCTECPPLDNKSDWESDLTGMGFGDLMTNRLVSTWSNYKSLTLPIKVDEGYRFHIRVYNRNGVLLFQSESFVMKGHPQDELILLYN
jgi:hypothetical protein